MHNMHPMMAGVAAYGPGGHYAARPIRATTTWDSNRRCRYLSTSSAAAATSNNSMTANAGGTRQCRRSHRRVLVNKAVTLAAREYIVYDFTHTFNIVR